MFYLDNFPRDGKYNHFAQFGIIDGKLRPDGRYQRPVVALVCNFTPPVDGNPSLLTHDEVTTLFHEFGHALHSMLTRAHYVQFAGTNVPRDFVEAPSQMLENWVWSKPVLDRFAADYRDPSRKIDPAFIAKMEAARLATSGTFYRRQAAFALGDLRLHGPGDSKDSRAIMNATMSEVFLPPPDNSNFSASFGHLASYDAGYYGYLWAEAIAADMATKFEQSPDGYLSREVGMELRRKIYEPGGSVDMNGAVRAFLGRERSLDPFLEHIGAK
jgi:thimet oligopeptidase